jgi:hypothetical protein
MSESVHPEQSVVNSKRSSKIQDSGEKTRKQD